VRKTLFDALRRHARHVRMVMMAMDRRSHIALNPTGKLDRMSMRAITMLREQPGLRVAADSRRVLDWIFSPGRCLLGKLEQCEYAVAQEG